MKERLRLIWFALTASSEAVKGKSALIITEQDREYAKQVYIELQDTRSGGSWSVEGTSIGYYADGFDVSRAHRFMEYAPSYVERLAKIILGKEFYS